MFGFIMGLLPLLAPKLKYNSEPLPPPVQDQEDLAYVVQKERDRQARYELLKLWQSQDRVGRSVL